MTSFMLVFAKEGEEEEEERGSGGRPAERVAVIGGYLLEVAPIFLHSLCHTN